MQKHAIRSCTDRLVAVVVRPLAAMVRERRTLRDRDELERLSNPALRDLGLDRCAVRHGLVPMSPAGDEPCRTAPASQRWQGLADGPRLHAKP